MPQGYSWVDKEILMPDGTKIEDVPMHQAAIHYDNVILAELAVAVCGQARKDWQKLNKGERKLCCPVGNDFIYRTEVAGFFNSSFFGSIIGVIAPEMDQEKVIKLMEAQTDGKRARRRYIRKEVESG